MPRSAAPARQAPRPTTLALALALACGSAGGGPAAPKGPPHDSQIPASARTVVSIDFDDGYVEASQAATLLEARGMRGTFFIISGAIGQNNYLALDQIRAMAAAGHEIGGHTVNHPDLSLVASDEAMRQICDGRQRLVGLGFDVRSFAYPYGAYDAEVERMVQECGYGSARILGLDDTTAPAETRPPADAFAIQARWSVQQTDTLETLQHWVTAAEATGGWLHVVFHRMCDGCNLYGVTQPTFEAFLDWLAAREPLGTFVRTQQEVMGAPLLPAVAGPPPPPRPPSDLLLDPSLEQGLTTPDSVPYCWTRAGWGSNTFAWATVDGHGGGTAQRVAITAFATGCDATKSCGARWLTPSLDLGQCAVPASPSHRYKLSGWYRSDVDVLWTVQYRDANGGWRWWTDSNLKTGGNTPLTLPPGADWTYAEWTTPPLPADATAIGPGIVLNKVGHLDVDDLDVQDVGP